MNPYISILFTLLFTVYGQIILKWRMTDLKTEFPEELVPKLVAFIKMLFDPFIFSGFASAFIASFFWMAAVNKLELTKAYPFMSLAPALVFLVGVLFLGEQFSWGKVIGLVFIIFGTLITVKY
jgi:drug/metabolite transporter (DMT)-like permease